MCTCVCVFVCVCVCQLWYLSSNWGHQTPFPRFVFLSSRLPICACTHQITYTHAHTHRAVVKIRIKTGSYSSKKRAYDIFCPRSVSTTSVAFSFYLACIWHTAFDTHVHVCHVNVCVRVLSPSLSVCVCAGLPPAIREHRCQALPPQESLRLEVSSQATLRLNRRRWINRWNSVFTSGGLCRSGHRRQRRGGRGEGG